jgi:2-hydroxychromene-2-carboxylate isomerase
MRIGPLAAEAAVMVRFRPFLLGPIFKSQGWDGSPFNLYPAKGRHMWRDLERLCGDLSLPFRRPEGFPQNGLLAARVALVGLAEGWGEDFCRSIFHAQFAQGRRIDDVEVVGDLVARLDLERVRVLHAAQSEDVKLRLRQQTDEAQTHGVFGAPSFVTPDGELFWGNDRLERALVWTHRGR